MTPDRDTALRLIADASAGMTQTMKALLELKAMPEHDLPDDVRAGIMHSLKHWHDGAGVTLQLIGVIWLRVATLNSQDASRPAIEGGEA